VTMSRLFLFLRCPIYSRLYLRSHAKVSLFNSF